MTYVFGLKKKELYGQYFSHTSTSVESFHICTRVIFTSKYWISDVASASVEAFNQ